MNIETNLKPRNYTEREICRIVNQLQAKMYIKNKVYPIDLYTSCDKNGNDIIVYIFLRSETQEVYKAWMAHELNQEEQECTL